jgi:cytochrome b
MENSGKSAWSATVKLTHWLVALAVIVNFFNNTGEAHRLIGYASLCLVLMRILHGLLPNAPQSSQFYWPSVKRIQHHILEIKKQKFSHEVGHNPLGQWAVYGMWLLIFLLAATGWLSRTDAFWGEDWPVDLHALFSTLLQALVVIHLMAVMLMSRLQKQNLPKQMLTGK